MAHPDKKIFLACVGFILLFVSIFLLLETPFDFKNIRYWNGKEFVEPILSRNEKSNQKSTQPSMDSLVIELEESIKQIALHSKTPKVTKSVIKCPYKDKNLPRPICPAGSRTGCIKDNLSRDLRQRLEDLMNNENLKIAPKYRQILDDLGTKIQGHYPLIILHALSDNHYGESQAMLREVHEKIFPLVPNLKFVVYDLGLSPNLREEYEKLCRCQIIKFPFEEFPSFCKTLRCFCWKPFIIRAHLANADMVMWMDASIRYTNPEFFLDALRRAQLFGIQQNHEITLLKMPYRALPPTFYHYGFTPCTFIDFHNAASNWGIYRNSPLIEHAVLDIWAACGLNKTCTCSGPYGTERCNDQIGNPHITTHCHRPQTAIAIILARLWMEDYNSVAAIQESFDIWRYHKLHYFKKLLESEQYNNNIQNQKVIPVNS